MIIRTVGAVACTGWKSLAYYHPVFSHEIEYQGRLLWGNLIVEPDGVTSKKDAKNPNPALRSRPIIGIVNLTDLKWDGEEYTVGRSK